MAAPLAELAGAAVGRSFDVLVALSALLLMAPVMLLIALAIRIDTPGPVFFAQTRLGRNGAYFQLYKFRKFHHRLSSTGPAVTLKNDPRMTCVGRVLEQSKLDELPQLLNILRGDMSIVGPRPETMEFADCFTGRFLHVLDYRPGLFGPNQVVFRREIDLYPRERDPHEFYRNVLFPMKANIDLAYFNHRNLSGDVLWIVRGMAATLGLPVGHLKLGRSDAIGLDDGLTRPSVPSQDDGFSERN